MVDDTDLPLLLLSLPVVDIHQRVAENFDGLSAEERKTAKAIERKADGKAAVEIVYIDNDPESKFGEGSSDSCVGPIRKVTFSR